MAAKQRTVAVLLFEDVEDLDFCGPLSVFSIANRGLEAEPFSVFTVAQKKSFPTRHGVTITPAFSFDNHPAADIIVIPGGLGARREVHNDTVKAWIVKNAAAAEHILSVCTGALLLASTGLLNGLQATTHASSFDKLQEIAPAVKVVRDKRFVDNGKIVVAAGIMAGIDASLYLVGKLVNEECAGKVKKIMEYSPAGG
ncbi:MAG: AraC family transcriptional regulator [Nitrospirae bacterium]|nr:MAG: AraC family transcriptional regulator [Nitrospirota bacterium]